MSNVEILFNRGAVLAARITGVNGDEGAVAALVEDALTGDPTPDALILHSAVQTFAMAILPAIESGIPHADAAIKISIRELLAKGMIADE